MARTLLQKILVFLIVTTLLAGCNLPFSSDTEQILADTQSTLNALSTQVAQLTTIPPAITAPPATEAPVDATEAPVLPTSPPPTEVTHLIVPAAFGSVEQMIDDTDSSTSASQKRAPGGENYIANVYERPFTSIEMVYRPDLDIRSSYLSRDNNFFYIQIKLKGSDPLTNTLHGTYGVEFETTFDMRGDYFVSVVTPTTTTWDQAGVMVYMDANKDVGGLYPVYWDTRPGNGFDQVIFPTGPAPDPDAAWARLSPSDPLVVELAIKRGVLNNPSAFLWNTWADDGVNDPAKKDYNDSFTHDIAGSSVTGYAQYPLKELALLDNTCRLNNGWTPAYEDSGLCRKPVPPTPTTPPNIPTLGPSSITGMVYYDSNINGTKDPLEGGRSQTIQLFKGACPESGSPLMTTVSSSSGNFSFPNLEPRNYCVKIVFPSQWYYTYEPAGNKRTHSVSLPAATTIHVRFGYVEIIY